MIPDAHCHLDQVPDPLVALDTALAAGVGPILAVSMDAVAAESILALKVRHRGQVLAGIGLHPSRVTELDSAGQEWQLRQLEICLGEADFVGEIGLDFKDALTDIDRDRQRDAFERQLAWAADRRLAVNCHSRRADRAVLEATIEFRRKTGLGVLMHWFTHSTKLARTCAQEGIFISPGPSVLIDPRTAEVARRIEKEILLLETDSPVVYGDLGSARPSWAARVMTRLAGIRECEEAVLSETLRTNLNRYMGRRASL